ncbi:hypothetical protein LTR66_001959 [Elasticomyces elasticus]|nr:hypothetical protein LTR66_001959 [Elasticomyces elasticus]
MASQLTIIASMWSLFALALVSFVARIHIHDSIFRHLSYPDLLAFLGLLLSFATALSTTTTLPSLFSPLPIYANAATAGPDIEADTHMFLRYQSVTANLALGCLWAVKASYLASLFKLTDEHKSLGTAWRAGAVMLVLTFIIGILCYPVSSAPCVRDCNAPQDIYLSLGLVRVNAAWDIITDIYVTVFPILTTMGMDLPISKWVSSVAILGVPLIPSVFAILRSTTLGMGQVLSMVSWFDFWIVIQCILGVLANNLMAWRRLYVRRRERRGTEVPSSTGQVLGTASSTLRHARRVFSPFSRSNT